MENNQFEQYNQIPAEKFAFVTDVDRTHDKRFETKPVGYFRDAFNRFKKNKASLVAAIIIIVLLLYALIGPLLFSQEYQDSYLENKKMLVNYKELKPKLFGGGGFWDGSTTSEYAEVGYWKLKAIAQETGYNPVMKVLSERTTSDVFDGDKTYYKIRVNSYYRIGVIQMTMTSAQYVALQKWQKENNMQVILPQVSQSNSESIIWYKSDEKGNPILDENGNLQNDYVISSGRDDYNSTRLASDPYNSGDTANAWSYAQRTGKPGSYNYVVRLNAYNYFQYVYGFEPSFIFGTDSNGYDIFSRLASGARFSFLLAVIVSAINLTLGAIYGAIEGYYGGVTDIIMERISDVLNGVPFMVVTVLFQLHLASKVGVVGSLIFAFILTGWIGMASRVRMQFYRFKNQEYVLAARTLGANDWRIIWKHIFPNTLGTLITGCVLVIPGVIFSETSLSYLGIINLDSSSMSSVGSMLSAGQGVMTSAPHVVLFPAIFIALLEISFNLFGNGLRDAFNPSLRGTEE